MKASQVRVLTCAYQRIKVEPIDMDATDHLLKEGLIEIDEERFVCTEKGRTLMGALCSVPMPIPAWTMPGRE